MPNVRLRRLRTHREARVQSLLTLLAEQPRAVGWTVGEAAQALTLNTAQLHGTVLHLRNLRWIAAVCERLSGHQGPYAGEALRAVAAFSITEAGRRRLGAGEGA